MDKEIKVENTSITNDQVKFVYNELSTNKKIHKTLAITKIIGYNNNCIKKLERVGTNPTLKCVLRG